MDAPGDDKIRVATRVAGALVIVVLLLAFLALYIEPDHTDQDFAWTILPRTSAILIGAGYTAGAYFFARVVTEKKWHRVQAGFLPITVFTVCMLAATLLHWGRFHQGAVAFYLWFIIYVITPLLVPFLWWQNRASASHELEAADVRLSPRIRTVLGIGAGLGILAFIVAFIQPSILISLAAWKLTPLTARVFSGWSILTLATVISIAADGRWSATRYLVQSAMVGLGLTLLALPRIWGDLDQSSPMTFIFVAGVGLTLVAFVGLHVRLDGNVRRKLRSGTEAGRP